jgi:hypothetical protein
MKKLILCSLVLSLAACTGETRTPVAKQPDSTGAITPDSARRGADSLGRPLPPPVQ